MPGTPVIEPNCSSVIEPHSPTKSSSVAGVGAVVEPGESRVDVEFSAEQPVAARTSATTPNGIPRFHTLRTIPIRQIRRGEDLNIGITSATPTTLLPD